MKRLVTILTVACLLGLIGVADAAFRAGTYTGKTQRDKPLSFTATKKQVSEFKIRVQYGCTDFDTFWVTEKGFPAMDINDEDKFSGRFTNANGSYSAKIRGTLTGKTAKGSFLAERTYNRQGNLDPQGSITCSVHKTTWTAKKNLSG